MYLYNYEAKCNSLKKSYKCMVTRSSKLTAVGVIMYNGVDWAVDPFKNGRRCVRTLTVYKAPVSTITMKTGKRRRDRSDMKDGMR